MTTIESTPTISELLTNITNESNDVINKVKAKYKALLLNIIKQYQRKITNNLTYHNKSNLLFFGKPKEHPNVHYLYEFNETIFRHDGFNTYTIFENILNEINSENNPWQLLFSLVTDDCFVITMVKTY
jgi:hypothetical protein